MSLSPVSETIHTASSSDCHEKPVLLPQTRARDLSPSTTPHHSAIWASLRPWHGIKAQYSPIPCPLSSPYSLIAEHPVLAALVSVSGGNLLQHRDAGTAGMNCSSRRRSTRSNSGRRVCSRWRYLLVCLLRFSASFCRLGRNCFVLRC
jgi:hypothetical protein